MGPQVNVRISPAGVVTFDVNGVQGQGCEKLTEQVEIHLGGGAKKTTKPEYHMPDSTTVGATLTF